MAKKNKDWWDISWNPVTGCKYGCIYCTAKTFATRFGGAYDNLLGGNRIIQPYEVLPEIVNGVIHTQMMIASGSGDTMTMRKAPYPMGFEPTYHKLRLEDPAILKKPKNIFVCIMADLFGEWVPDEWIREVMQACAAAPQHRYLFLTKNPKRLTETPDAENYWFGTTINNNDDISSFGRAQELYSTYKTNKFLSIEPLQEQIVWGLRVLKLFDWVIIGAETGNRKGKIIPKRSWIIDITLECKARGVPVFMKESLKRLMGRDFIQEFPW